MNKHPRKPLRLDRTTIRSLTKRDLSSVAGAFRLGTGGGKGTFTSALIGCPPPQSLVVACVSLGATDCSPGTQDCPIASIGC